MELGAKIRQARLDAGLSQRQLCGGEITRNMLSQIENGSAHPSMATLQYLAKQLGKPVSFFLDEDAVTSPNLTVMEQARSAFQKKDLPAVAAALKAYRGPDPVFDLEYRLLHRLAALDAIDTAIKEGKLPYAAQLLEELGPIRDGYCCADLERRRLLLAAKIHPLSENLPDIDEELLLRAKNALKQAQPDRAEHFLEAVQGQDDPSWQFLRGEVHLAKDQFEAAARCFQRAENAYPAPCAARLERCYRELGNYEKAYFYVLRQRRHGG